VRTVVLARHGESVFSAQALVNGESAVPGPLTERGREEALVLGEQLSDDAIDLCVTSEFERVRETADLALAGREIPRLVLSGLNDPLYGSFEGGPLADYRAWAHAHRSDEAPEGGEARQEIVARYAAAFREVLARPEATVLVVAHSLPIAYILGKAPPGPVVPLVEHATAYRLSAGELGAAVSILEDWLAAPTW
jgi:broad specificity phosphatase PhoE